MRVNLTLLINKFRLIIMMAFLEKLTVSLSKVATIVRRFSIRTNQIRLIIWFLILNQMPQILINLHTKSKIANPKVQFYKTSKNLKSKTLKCKEIIANRKLNKNRSKKKIQRCQVWWGWWTNWRAHRFLKKNKQLKVVKYKQQRRIKKKIKSVDKEIKSNCNLWWNTDSFEKSNLLFCQKRMWLILLYVRVVKKLL